MSYPDVRDIKSTADGKELFEWKHLLSEALLELDEARLPQRIATARNAILQRLEKWQDGQHGDKEEKVALRDALNTLQLLQNVSGKAQKCVGCEYPQLEFEPVVIR